MNVEYVPFQPSIEKTNGLRHTILTGSRTSSLRSSCEAVYQRKPRVPLSLANGNATNPVNRDMQIRVRRSRKEPQQTENNCCRFLLSLLSCELPGRIINPTKPTRTLITCEGAFCVHRRKPPHNGFRRNVRNSGARYTS